MVCYNAQRNVRDMIFAVFDAGHLRNAGKNVLYRVNVEKAVNVLHNAGKSFKPHTRVDILLFKRGIVIMSVIVELGENDVPELNVSVAVTADMAVGTSAAFVRASVEVYLRAGTAGTRAVLPEVVLLAHTRNMGRINSDLLCPYIIRLVVLEIYRHIKFVNGHLHNLCAELPRPGDSLALEVIAEREVAQHFKKRAVTRVLSDAVYIGRSDTFLAGGDPVSRRRLLTGEVRLHRGHTRVYKKDAFIILRNKRKARKAQMSLAFEKREILFSYFIQTHVVHCKKTPFRRRRGILIRAA